MPARVSTGAGLSWFLSSDSDMAGFRPRVFHADLDQLFSNSVPMGFGTLNVDPANPSGTGALC
jgi:hypothetical protein